MKHPDLAAIARLELQARERETDWPADDIAAWRAIADLLDRGEVETELEWPALVEAARAAEDRRIAAFVAARSTAIEHRLVDVANIRRTLERSAWRHGFCFSEAA